MVTKKQIEDDAQFVLVKMRDADYEIPTSWDVSKIIFRRLVVVYVIQFLGVFIDLLMHKSVWDSYDTSNVMFTSLVSCAVVTLLWFMVFYGNVSLTLCISEEIKKQSIICQIINSKIKKYFSFTLFVVVISATYLIFYGPAWIGLLGIAWIVCTLIGGIAFNMSISRYMTPVVVVALTNIRQLFSSVSVDSRISQ